MSLREMSELQEDRDYDYGWNSDPAIRDAINLIKINKGN